MLFLSLSNLTVGDVVAVLLAIGALVGIYSSINVRLKALEIEVKNIQKNEDRAVDRYDALMEEIKEFKETTSGKFDMVNQNFRELLIEVSKKI